MATLIVHLPALPGAAAGAYRYVLTSDGHAATSHGSAAAALLPQPAKPGGDIVAVVPARALSWQQVELPKGSTSSAARLRAVLEGLLEERLLDDPEALHLAVQPGARAGQPAWVAVCNRAWLHASLQALEAAGRRVSRIVPEFTPATDAESRPALHAIGEPEDAWLVATDRSGVTLLPLTAASLALLGPQAGASGGLDDPAAVDGPECTAEPAVAALAEQLLQRPVQLRQGHEHALAAARSAWDLAQFDLASSGRARTLKQLGTGWRDLLQAPQWRAARWGAALLVLANLVGLNAWAWREQAALDVRRVALRSTLQTTFPNVRVVVDAPVQMEREVAALRQASGASSGRDLEAMLGVLATAVPPGRTAGPIDFAPGELRVRGLGLGSRESADVAGRLRTLGYTGRLQADTLVVQQEIAP